MNKWGQSTEKWLQEDRREALEQLVWFKPVFDSADDLQQFTCFEKSYGPFKKNVNVRIPIWIGLELESRNRGLMYPPAWLREKELKEIIMNEKRNMHAFQPVDEWFVYIAHVFLSQAKYFQVHPKKAIADAMRTLTDVRRHKCTEGLRFLDQTILNVTNMTKPEVTYYRERAVKAMSWLADLNGCKDEEVVEAKKGPDGSTLSSSSGSDLQNSGLNQTTDHGNNTTDLGGGGDSSINNNAQPSVAQGTRSGYGGAAASDMAHYMTEGLGGLDKS